jgi:hypothetical protein
VFVSCDVVPVVIQRLEEAQRIAQALRRDVDRANSAAAYARTDCDAAVMTRDRAIAERDALRATRAPGGSPGGGCFYTPPRRAYVEPRGGGKFYKGGQFTPGGGRAPKGGCYM